MSGSRAMAWNGDSRCVLSISMLPVLVVLISSSVIFTSAKVSDEDFDFPLQKSVFYFFSVTNSFLIFLTLLISLNR
jgi:hypothetical protein